ncbi:MAG TPA: arginyltransferase, partial [Gammaproteobacteria bacterium]|nr:arginyltransferase [Gammaproteobacteria bacterium]
MTAKPSLNQLAFYASRPHPCSYLTGRDTVNLFTDPDAPMDMAIYSRLADFGFRRSGGHIYRPRCPQCQACLPVRIPVSAFQPSRAQRRTLKANRDVQATLRPAAFDE